MWDKCRHTRSGLVTHIHISDASMQGWRNFEKEKCISKQIFFKFLKVSVPCAGAMGINLVPSKAIVL